MIKIKPFSTKPGVTFREIPHIPGSDSPLKCLNRSKSNQYDDYVAMLTKNTEGDSVPREVAEKAILEAMPLIKAWRLHLGLTLKDVAKRAGITQGALSQMERAENINRTITLKNWRLPWDCPLTRCRIKFRFRFLHGF